MMGGCMQAGANGFGPVSSLYQQGVTLARMNVADDWMQTWSAPMKEMPNAA